jgi:hypothetical protein
MNQGAFFGSSFGVVGGGGVVDVTDFASAFGATGGDGAAGVVGSSLQPAITTSDNTMLETIEQTLIPSLMLTVALLEKLAVGRDISS